MTKQPNHHVTFSPEALKAVLDEAVAEALAKHDAKPKRTVPAHGNGKAPQDAAQMDKMVVTAFRRAGFTDAQPRLNVLTYRKWLEQGHRVKPGERSVRVRQFRLFHKSQVESFAPSEKVIDLKPKATKPKKAEPELPMGA